MLQKTMESQQQQAQKPARTRSKKKKTDAELLKEAEPIVIDANYKPEAQLPLIPKTKRVVSDEERKVLLARLELARAAKLAKKAAATAV